MGAIDSTSLRAVLARNVRTFRHALGLSQEELAELAGLHRTYIGSIERGERNVSVDNIERLAKALDVTPQRLLLDGDRTQRSLE
jgi:transcriptional regulator with XRE-family HTH domain